MNDQFFDRLFKDKINKVDELPLGVNWTPEKGWANLTGRNRQKKSIRMISIISVAASLGLMTGIWMLYKDTTPENNVIKTGLTEKKEVVIDNSSIWLNRSTQLYYPSSLNSKSLIKLSGEAFFDFRQCLNREITIQTKNVQIFSAGSAFNVKLDTIANSITITPVSGKLKVTNPTIADFPTIEIVPGRIAYITPTDEIIIVDNDDPNFLAWKTGMLEFKSAPLRYVAQKLQDTYGIKVKVVERIEYCTISMDCKNVPLPDILNKLQKQLNLKINRTMKEIVMSGGNCI